MRGGFLTFLLLGLSYIIGMIPNAFIYQKFVPISRLKYVRSDYIDALDMLKHIKEPPFFLTVGTDLLKGVALALLGMFFSESGTLALIMILVAIFARNFNVFIGIRNGHGMAILFGGLMVYAPIVIIPMVLFTMMIGFFSNALDMALVLSVVLLPVSLAFLPDPLGAVIISLMIMCVILTHQLMYAKEAARRTRYKDSRYHNPYE